MCKLVKEIFSIELSFLKIHHVPDKGFLSVLEGKSKVKTCENGGD